MWYSILIAVLTAYLLGNINGSVCISQIVAGEDVRSHGSGNAGLTNFFRTYGSWSTLLVLGIDAGKTVLAILVGGLLLKPYEFGQEGAVLGAVAVSLGHDFPALLGFKGGKGIVCGLAVSAMLDWRIALIILGVFVVVFAITRYVSLGSLLASVTFSVCFALFHLGEPWLVAGGIFLGALAVFMHRANIVRLIKGTEKKVHLIHREKNKE
jgi:glycerol-3-phosphate acyltransferase PlsY